MAEECPECRGTGKISTQNCLRCGDSPEVIIHSHPHRHGDQVHEHPHPHPEGHHPADDKVPHEHEHTI